MNVTIIHRVGKKLVGCWVSVFDSVEAAKAEATLQGYDVVEARPTTDADRKRYHYVYMLGDESY